MTTTHVTIIAPGARRGQLRDSAPRSDVYHEGVELTRDNPSPTTAYAWDGVFDDKTLQAARDVPGATIYQRGVDAESMQDAIEQAGYVRVEPDDPLS